MGSSLPPSSMMRENAQQPSGSSLPSPTFSAHPSSQFHNLLCFPPCLGTGNLPKKQTIKTNQAKRRKRDIGRRRREREGEREMGAF